VRSGPKEGCHLGSFVMYTCTEYCTYNTVPSRRHGDTDDVLRHHEYRTLHIQDARYPAACLRNAHRRATLHDTVQHYISYVLKPPMQALNLIARPRQLFCSRLGLTIVKD
jgi:hypothetical protein